MVARAMYRLEIPDLFAHLLHTRDVGFAIKALDGRYVYANPGYAQMLGIPDADEVLGRQDGDMLVGDAAAVFLAAHQRVQAERGAVEIVHEARVEDGTTRQFALTHFPVGDEDGMLEAVGVVALTTHTVEDGGGTEQALRSAEKVNSQLRSTINSLQELASTDTLTRVWNRRHCEDLLESETHRSIRFGHPLSILLIDIDHFKSINDRFGHGAGDRVLAEFADCLRDGMRRSDELARWGGEEFLLLMPSTGLAGAHRSGERIRERLAQSQFTAVGGLSASIGVAEFAPTESIKEWLARADEALYRAKRGGRNRVEVDASVATEAPPETSDGNFIHLVWKQRFACGHPMIDRQHRHLFDRCNRLLSAVVTNQPLEEIDNLIRELIDKVTRHFHDEEELLDELGFEDLPAHRREHATLMARALEMASSFRARQLSTGELFEFIAHDVVARHLLGADRQYFKLLQPAED
jgi:diguanylate cyclase (GGDEF)-like protein/hemerythrin-like metal-binding protein/PAS domain S-box-containing protein